MNPSTSLRFVSIASALAKARATAPPALRGIQSIRPFAVTSRKQQNQTTPVDPKPLRPISPHLSIYQPQLTWYLSSAHRITGVALSGLFYLTFAAYAAAPSAGLGFSSADAVAYFGALPVAAKIGTKFLLAYPFTFHSFNGVRHLMWDTAKGLTLKGVYTSGYVVLGASTITALGLAMM